MNETNSSFGGCSSCGSVYSQRSKVRGQYDTFHKHPFRTCKVDSPISRAIHGSQRGQVVRAAQVPVQSVLPWRQVGGGGWGKVRGGWQELHRGGVMVAAGPAVQACRTHRAHSVKQSDCTQQIKTVSQQWDAVSLSLDHFKKQLKTLSKVNLYKLEHPLLGNRWNYINTISEARDNSK